MKQKNYILASASPRRKELLESIGLSFTVEVSDADESRISRDIPVYLYVQELALAKAAAVAKNHPGEKNTLIIGADTVVACDGGILGKPKSKMDAFKMLWALSGKTHEVYTGICVIDPKTGKAVCDREVTHVTFKQLSQQKIIDYIKTGEPMDKAGSYGIQGMGGLLIERISGDYANVVGLPLSKLSGVLENHFNVNLME